MSESPPLSETVRIGAEIAHPVAEVWAAFADTAARATWGVPDGEAMVYDHDDFRAGGSTAFRCGTPGVLEFHASGDYPRIEPEAYVVSTETLRSGDQVLSTAIVTWTFTATPAGTHVEITDQLVSFVGEGMVDGHRNGHTIALRQLGDFLDAGGRH